ncbi:MULTISPECIES: hypothetical protein [unclassified Crossiella]|uniref:hypothetical protein n=1 Tax=unclassified Crossiella TaxID=2620835 RepID=UPI001FFE717E|nr:MULTISPECIES: hypothetical protein [unclassified Crossiella]MCK2237923.1 hypothetical protein [Crossiella sp. S99.2]MCK2255209.1 hypothetical protein [Crossiella sp. S99.1]
MQPANPEYAQHVLARLTDFCQVDGVLWTRRLWDIGSILALEELWESASWQSRRVISGTAFDWQRHQLACLIGPDLGMGDKDLRREAVQLLGSDTLTDPSKGHRRLRLLIDRARDGYLDRWADRVADGAQVKPERLARSLAAHLLDLGYTAPFLATQWLSGLRSKNSQTEAIIASAAGLARIPPRNFHVLLPLSSVPDRSTAENSSEWLNNSEVVSWLKREGHSSSGVRSNGGFLYQVSARDPYGAADKVRRLFERIVARSLFSSRDRGRVAAFPMLWVSGHPEPLPLRGPARHADVQSLAHQGRLYDVSRPRTPIDDALELAAPVNLAGASAATLAGAWAAIESLLCHPGDPVPAGERSGKAVAADRLASIVACSWPRVEMVTLIRRHGGEGEEDELTRRRDSRASVREQAHSLLAEITANGVANLRFHGRTRYSDQVAAQRLAACVAEPKRVVGELASVVRIALRRLYRARNIVLHGGSTTGVALDATLRTAAPLLGAGLDRIAHAYFGEPVGPLDLAERAEQSIAMVGGETGLTLVDLLRAPGTAA